MIDFHSHILPGIDDGSKDLDMSIQMLNISVDEGVDHICATPHFIVEEYEIKKDEYIMRLNKLKDFYKNNEINIMSGLEVYIHPELATLYKRGAIWGLNDTRYILVELPMAEFPIYTEKVFYHLRLEGALPIIAHPERNLKIMKNIELLVSLVEQGVVVQMNSGSITGMYGDTVKRFAEKLINMNMVHILGSDGHNISTRPTIIGDAYKKIEKINNSHFRRMLECQNTILEGNPLELPEVILPKRSRKGFFGFLNR